jgi:hypothetical protein
MNPRLLCALGALLLPVLAPRVAVGMCSASGLDAVYAQLRTATAPPCATGALRHAFKHTVERAALATERAVIECAIAETPHIAPAHRALLRLLRKIAKLDAAGRMDAACAATAESEVTALDAELTGAANGVPVTTTTTAPGATTTTTPPACATITLEVDKGDCTSVTSDPPGVVKCGADCDVRTFTIPASRPLQLKGTPAPGDQGVSFDTDCNDDGTVPLSDASPPDCSLSCDCSSGL